MNAFASRHAIIIGGGARTVTAQFPAAMKTIRTGYWKNSSGTALNNCDAHLTE
jgi:hypothetical protein